MFVETPLKIKDSFGRQSAETLVSKAQNKTLDQRESSQMKENPKIKNITAFFFVKTPAICKSKKGILGEK